MRRSQPGLIVSTTVEFRVSLPEMRCKSLQRTSSPAIPGTSARRLIGAAEESRCRERRIREVRRSRLPTWTTHSPAPSSPLAICGGTGRKKKETLRPVRSLSFVILLRPSRANLSHRSPSEVLPAFNEYHPGCPPGVYFYDASEIRLTRMGDGGMAVQEETTAVRERKRHEATITIGEFLLLCLFLLSVRLATSQALLFFYAKTPWSLQWEWR